ncbi:hypothetical protein RND81_02G210600 [Saponaria officinalis]|uniref:AB hydrolase-1 domain-containing protein n=1 Tax=Saponaria officinalis TaxID=3572 RepID=A0AAW1MV78_SAPOF
MLYPFLSFLSYSLQNPLSKQGLSFMASGGYNVTSQINQVKQQTLVIWGENDRIISYKLAVKLQSELQDAILRPIPDCGHIPHVKKLSAVANLILKFVQNGQC